MPLTSDMCFSTDGQLIFLSCVLPNPPGTVLCFKGCARNWALKVDLKEVQAHFCPQTNLLTATCCLVDRTMLGHLGCAWASRWAEGSRGSPVLTWEWVWGW